MQGIARNVACAFVLTLIAHAATTSVLPAQQSCWWEERESCPEPRFEAATFDLDGRMYLLGGFHPFPAVTRSIHRYDPASDVWITVGDMPVKLTHAPAALVGRDAWLAGGFQGDNPGTAVSTVWIWDVDANAWTNGPPLPIAVAGGGFVELGGKLHYFGGVLADRDTMSAAHFVLDLAHVGSGWTTAADLPVPRTHLSGIALDGRIYCIGGQERHDTNPVDYDRVHVYDPALDAWTELSPLPFSRSHAEAGTFVWNGQIVITGGKSSSLGAAMIPDTSIYDPALDEWSSLPPLPEALLAPSARVLAGLFVASCGAGEGLLARNQTLVRPANDVFDRAFRVNVGGPEYLATTGHRFCADQGVIGGKVFTNHAIGDVANTADDFLYVSERYGDTPDPTRLHVRFPLPGGKYRVRLHFAEIFFGAPGGDDGGPGLRVFDVDIEGARVLEDYDIFARVGAAAADVHAFDVEVRDLALDVELHASVNRPKISAFEIVELGPGSFENYCKSEVNSSGGAARIGFVGTTSFAENDLVLRAAPVPNQPGLFFYGPTRVEIPFGNGYRCVGGVLKRLPVVSASANELVFAVDNQSVPHGGQLAPGATWNFQAWFRDPAAGGAQFDLSDGLSLLFTP